MALERAQRSAMRFPLFALTFVECFSWVHILRADLNKSCDVQAPVELPIPSGINANSRVFSA
jgi:hypothetical protein